MPPPAPRRRSGWWRAGAGVAAWLVLVVAAAGAAWAAVGVIGDQSEPAQLPVAPADDGGQAPTPTQTRPSGSPDPTGSGGDSRTISSAGGTVTVTCTGDEVVRMTSAIPVEGWRSVVEERGPDEVEIEFVQGDVEVRVRSRCHDGVVESDVDGD